MPISLVFLGILPTLFGVALHVELNDVDMEMFQSVVGVSILILISHFAVAWHRSILLNDKRPKLLRFGRNEINYLGVTLGLWLSVWLIEYFIDSIDITTRSLFMVFILFLFAFGLYLFILSISLLVPVLLPAIAIKDAKMSLDKAWKHMRGWRLRFLVFWAIQTTVWAGPFMGLLYCTKYVREPVWNLFGLRFEEQADSLNIYLIMAAETLISIPPVMAFVVTTGGVLAGLSISYAGLASHVLKHDKAYEPVPAFNKQLSVTV